MINMSAKKAMQPMMISALALIFCLGALTGGGGETETCGVGGAALRGISISLLQLGQFTTIPAPLSSTARCCPQRGQSNWMSMLECAVSAR